MCARLLVWIIKQVTREGLLVKTDPEIPVICLSMTLEDNTHRWKAIPGGCDRQEHNPNAKVLRDRGSGFIKLKGTPARGVDEASRQMTLGEKGGLRFVHAFLHVAVSKSCVLRYVDRFRTSASECRRLLNAPPLAKMANTRQTRGKSKASDAKIYSCLASHFFTIPTDKRSTYNQARCR